MNEKSFEQLIEHYIQGKASKGEIHLLEKWLDSLDSESKAFENLADTQKLLLKQKMKATIYERTKGRKRDFTISKSGQNFPVWSKIAASIIFIIGMFYLFQQFDTSIRFGIEEMITARSTGQVSKQILSDGTIVWLKGNSTLQYPEVFEKQRREIILEGEALFEVAKDPARPFLIHCSDMTAKVLGTSFNIRSSDEQIEIAVLTGKVEISSNENKDATLLTPHETGIYSRVTNQTKKTITQRASKYLVGTEYDMNFTNQRVESVLAQIGQKFSVEVVVKNKNIHNCLLTANLTDQSLKNTLEMMCPALSIQYEISENEVIIMGEGCP